MFKEKNNNNTSSRKAITFLLCLLVMSCHDLDNDIHTQVTENQFFQTEDEFVSALGAAYTSLASGSAGILQVQAATTDEIIVPTRGQDWQAGGQWLRFGTHTWNQNDFNGAWTYMFTGVNASNRLIFQFESAVEAGAAEPELATPIISELKTLRAFHYLNLLDVYGNVPIITSFVDTPENPSQPSSDFQNGRQAVFDFVEQELLDNVPNLNTNKQDTYARINRYVGHMILAKLYMNAEVFTGTPRWNDALTHLNAIIESGEYNLAADYHANFAVNNIESPENMFVIPYDEVFLPGFFLHRWSLHYVSQATYDFQTQPFNGWSATQKLYESYIDADQNPGPQGEVWGVYPTDTEDGLDRIQGTLDERTTNVIVGPQYSSSGERLIDSGVFSDYDKNGPPLTFTPALNELYPSACRQCGGRIGKYEFERGINTSMNNDFVIYRYADVLLLKAEALWRLNPNDSDAIELVNRIRSRAGVYSFSSLDSDKILNERLREMFYELTRRQDLIRFTGEIGETRYNDPWKFKDVSESYRNVMPIPRNQLETNPNLVQNPGY